MAWHSVLTLAFDAQHAGGHARTNLVQRHHQGALRVQKALYPESGEQQGICHVIMLYPPAGIALGDKLDIDIGVKHHAHAVITTPGANKWYGNLPSYTPNKQTDDSAPIKKPQKPQKNQENQETQETQENSTSYAAQNITVYLQDDSRFEWLPQENCFYNASFAHATNQFFISPAASVIAWEINLLGREHHGERYRTGEMRLSNLFWRVDEQPKLLLADTLDHCAEHDWFGSAVGLNNHSVFASLWVVPSVDAQKQLIEWVKQLRLFIERHSLPVSCTQTGEVMIIRYLGDDVRQCFDSFGAVRGEIRTLMWQQASHLPRIWAT